METIKEYPLKKIKARIFLNQSIHENEIFSNVINAKSRNDNASYKEALTMLRKPLSKQSKILLLEYFRITIQQADEKTSQKLLKTLLSKTNQSFVIDLVFKYQKTQCFNSLIKLLINYDGYKSNNALFLLFRLWENKIYTRKKILTLLNNYKLSLMKQLDLANSFYLFCGPILDRNQAYYDPIHPYPRHRKILLKAMEIAIFLTKIGVPRKAAIFIRDFLSSIDKSPIPNFSKNSLFSRSFGVHGNYRGARSFTDGCCRFSEITKFLETDFQELFEDPFNKNELIFGRLVEPNPLLFVNEIMKYTSNTEILEMMFPIFLESNNYKTADIFGYLSLLKKINSKEGRKKKIISDVNNFFLGRQHNLSKVAYLVLDQRIYQEFGFSKAKLKKLYGNHFLSSRFFCWNKVTVNRLAFKYIYMHGNDDIKDWLEDLYIAKKFTSGDRCLRKPSFSWSKPLVEENEICGDANIFSSDKIIMQNFIQRVLEKANCLEQKLNDESNDQKSSKNVKSIQAGIVLLENSKTIKDAGKAFNFLNSIKVIPSYKKFGSMTRAEILEDNIDFMASWKFRKALNNFALFAIKNCNLKNLNSDDSLWNFSKIVIGYCNKQTYDLFDSKYPYQIIMACFNRPKRGYSFSYNLRLKKALDRIDNLSYTSFINEIKKYIDTYFQNFDIDKTRDGHHPKDDIDMTMLITFLNAKEKRDGYSLTEGYLKKCFDQLPGHLHKIFLISKIKKGSGPIGLWSFNTNNNVSDEVSSILESLEVEFNAQYEKISKEEVTSFFKYPKDWEHCARFSDIAKPKLLLHLAKTFPRKEILGLLLDTLFFSKINNKSQNIYEHLPFEEFTLFFKKNCEDLLNAKEFDTESWFVDRFVKNAFLVQGRFESFTDLNDYIKNDLSELSELIQKYQLKIIKKCIENYQKQLAKFSLRNRNEYWQFHSAFSSIIDLEQDAVKVFYQELGYGDCSDYAKNVWGLELFIQNLNKRETFTKYELEALLKIYDNLFYSGYSRGYTKNDAMSSFLDIETIYEIQSGLKRSINCAVNSFRCKSLEFLDTSMDKDMKVILFKNFLESGQKFSLKYKEIMNEEIMLDFDLLPLLRKHQLPYWANSLKI